MYTSASAADLAKKPYRPNDQNDPRWQSEQWKALTSMMNDTKDKISVAVAQKKLLEFISAFPQTTLDEVEVQLTTESVFLFLFAFKPPVVDNAVNALPGGREDFPYAVWMYTQPRPHKRMANIPSADLNGFLRSFRMALRATIIVTDPGIKENAIDRRFNENLALLKESGFIQIKADSAKANERDSGSSSSSPETQPIGRDARILYKSMVDSLYERLKNDKSATATFNSALEGGIVKYLRDNGHLYDNVSTLLSKITWEDIPSS
jgi:hypothetical protein